MALESGRLNLNDQDGAARDRSGGRQFRPGKNYLIGKNYSIYSAACRENPVQRRFGIVLSKVNRFYVNLLEQFARPSLDIAGLARRLRSIWNLVTAPQTCGRGRAGTNGGFMKTGKTLVTTLFAIASYPLLAQQPPPAYQQSSPATQQNPASMPPQAGPAGGAATSAVELSPVSGELVSKLDTKTAKTGDSVEVQTKAPVKTADGTAIPKGSKLVGHVLAVHPSAAGDNSQVVLLFDHLELKGGQNVPIHSQIQSIAPASATASASGPAAGGSSNPSASANGGSRASGAPQATAGDSGAASAGAPAAGTVVARTGNIAIATTSVPGVLLANNAPGQQDPRMAQASSILLGAKQDIQLDGGTQMVVGVSAAGGTQ